MLSFIERLTTALNEMHLMNMEQAQLEEQINALQEQHISLTARHKTSVNAVNHLIEAYLLLEESGQTFSYEELRQLAAHANAMRGLQTLAEAENAAAVQLLAMINALPSDATSSETTVE